MIGVNTNNVTKDINIILNNASIDTDSKKAPAILELKTILKVEN